MSAQQIKQGKEQAAVLPAALENAPRIEAPPVALPTLVPRVAGELAAHHGEFASFHEEYVRHHIQFADAKAGVCFAAISAVLGYLISKDEIQTLILRPAWTVQFGIIIAALMLLLAAAAFSFAVIAPRLGSHSAEGIVFFGAVAKRETGDAYIADVMACSETDLTTVRLKHSFDISKICARKYWLLKVAIWSAMPGLILALIAILHG